VVEQPEALAMKTYHSIPIFLLLFIPLTLRACTDIGQSDLTCEVELTSIESTAAVRRITSQANLQTLDASLATFNAQSTASASPRATFQTVVNTATAPPLTAPPNTAPPPTSTDLVAIGQTPEDAALLTLKAWAAQPYQNEQAVALKKDDQQAQIKVSAEFKDSAGQWTPMEALTQCVHVHAGWKCLPEFNFAPAVTPTPGS
jgi:hypothetical protein